MNEQREQLQSLAAGVRSRVSGKLGDIWWVFMLRGVFAGLLGIGFPGHEEKAADTERLFDFVDVDEVGKEQPGLHVDRPVVNYRRAQHAGIGFDSGRPHDHSRQRAKQHRDHAQC
jgi:hypothetical protein